MLNIIHSTNSDVSSKNFPLLACFAAPSYPCQGLVCWGCVGRFEGGENKSSAHDRCCRHGYLLAVVTVANWAAEQMGREVNFFCVKGNWPFAVVNNAVGWWEFKYWLDTHRLLCNTVACSDYSPCTTTSFSIFGCFLFYDTRLIQLFICSHSWRSSALPCILSWLNDCFMEITQHFGHRHWI